MMRHRDLMLMLGGVLLVIAGLAMGCDTRATQTGQEGKLQFYYTAADGNTRFDRPLAVGSFLTMYVEGLEGREVGEVLSVEASDAEVVSVRPSDAAPQAIMLRGLKAGRSEVHVQVASGGGRLADTIVIEVAQVRHVELSHACTDDLNAAYLQNRPVHLEMTRLDEQRREMVGTTSRCPVTLEPEGLGEDDELVRCDEGGLYLRGIAEPGPVRVTGRSSNPRGGRDQLGVQIVTADLIDFPAIDGFLEERRTATLQLEPDTGMWPICYDFGMDVDVLTPETCLGAGRERSFHVPASEQNRLRLRGVAPGECVFAVRLPEFGGRDIWEFSVPVYELDD